MSAWKQIVISLAVVAAAFFGWLYLYPGAPAILQKAGLAKPLSAVGINVASAPQADASGKGGGQGGGGRGRGRFSRTATVVVKPAGSAVINDHVAALGSAVALRSVTLVAKASGTLTEVPVDSGAQVEAGDVIARLDSVTEKLAVEKAQVANDDAQTTLQRNQLLAKTNAVSASTLQAAEAAARTADLTLRSAQQDLAERTITAPISGRLGIIQISVGNKISTSTTIATIEDTSALLVNYWLPDRLVGTVKVGDQATLVPVARPQETLQATVTAIDNKVDSASGTYEVQARLDNTSGALRPGMAFTVSMRFPGDRFISVDPLAIQWGSDGAYVWRVQDDKANKVAVRIVQRNTEDVLVAGKLNEGDAIVTEGLDGLRPGAEVKVQGAEGEQSGAKQADGQARGGAKTASGAASTPGAGAGSNGKTRAAKDTRTSDAAQPGAAAAAAD